MRPLTKRQSTLLRFIEGHVDEYGYPPSIREMADHMGISSTNGVNDHLKALERKGCLLRHGGLKSRAISLVGRKTSKMVADTTSQVSIVPLVGRVAAGAPVLSEENVDDYFHLDRSLTGDHEDLFALRVAGESMIERGILDGDFVLVKPQKTADSGQVVVALVDGEATVKTFKLRSKSVVLEPANPNMQPIEIPKHDRRGVAIVGIVKGVFRKL